MGRSKGNCEVASRVVRDPFASVMGGAKRGQIRLSSKSKLAREPVAALLESEDTLTDREQLEAEARELRRTFREQRKNAMIFASALYEVCRDGTVDLGDPDDYYPLCSDEEALEEALKRCGWATGKANATVTEASVLDDLPPGYDGEREYATVAFKIEEGGYLVIKESDEYRFYRYQLVTADGEQVYS